MRIRICALRVNRRLYAWGRNTCHSDEEPWLLRSAPDTGVSNNSNGKTCGETSETNGEASTELNETLEERHLRGDWR
jgi:hypothetical protein